MSYTRLTEPLNFDDAADRDPAPTTVPRNLPASVVTWLARLPAQARPMRTAYRFPHVVRQLSQLWHEPEKLAECFEQLLYDKRGKRMGFPTTILTELETLRSIAVLPQPEPDKLPVEPIAIKPGALPAEPSEGDEHNGFRSAKTMARGQNANGLIGRPRPAAQPALEFQPMPKLNTEPAAASKAPGADLATADTAPAVAQADAPADPFGVREQTAGA